MKYFKNTELAALFKVSEKSVRNWVESTHAGKLDLDLYENRGKSYIANTARNTAIVEELVKKGKKYKNTRGYKVVSPLPKFYEQFSSKQIFDIISNIDIYREVPYKYSFFGEGAHHWDQYTMRLIEEENPNSLTNTIQLLDLSEEYFSKILTGTQKVNVIDIGVGNSMPVKAFLEYLLATKRLNRYICLDISHEMIKISERNIKEWFGDQVKFEGYVRDIIYDRFNDLVTGDSLGESDESIVNLVLMVGGTIQNLRQPDHALANIHDSMGRNDFCIVSRGLDSPKSRRYFDFVSDSGGPNNNFRGKNTLELLGIDESLYTIEQSFDLPTMMRRLEIKLKVALSIAFEFDGQKRSITLDKDTRLLLWRVIHQNILGTATQFDNNDLEPVVVSKSIDQQYVQIISKIKTIP